MCKKSGEFTYHLLLHYEVPRDLWVSIFRVFGVEWVMPRRLVEFMVSWRGQLQSTSVRSLEDSACMFNMVHLEKLEREKL
jgi:hypothetical protein